MYNWSTDRKKLSQNREKYVVWRIEQKINYGLGSGKLRRTDLKKYWHKLHIDPHRRKYLELLLHGQ